MASKNAANQYVRSLENRNRRATEMGPYVPSDPRSRNMKSSAFGAGSSGRTFGSSGLSGRPSDEAQVDWGNGDPLATERAVSNAMMQLAGMSNHAKYANGAAVGAVDPFGDDKRTSGGGGGDGGYAARRAAAMAALAAQMGMFQQAEDAGRRNAEAATGNINNIYDELNARLGSHRDQFTAQAAELAARLRADQAAAAAGLNDQLGVSEQALAAQFGGGLAASLADGNAAQMAALRAAMGQRHQLDQRNLDRTTQIGRESFDARIGDSATARAASQQQVQNNLGALLQELAAERARAQAAAAGVA